MADDNLERTLTKLQGSENDNKEVLREIILQYQKCNIKACPRFNQIITILLTRFSTNFETESHILIMNAVCVLLNSLVKNDEIVTLKLINAILNIHVKNDIHSFGFVEPLTYNIKNAIQLYFIEGLLKSNILNDDKLNKCRFAILLEMFTITENSCMSCQKSSFAGFRGLYEVIKYFTKYDYWVCLEYIHISKILLIINSNWDNSVTGVRDSNCRILQETLKNIHILCLPEISLNAILEGTLKHLSWLNKSKYFILAELVKIYTSDYMFELLLTNSTWEINADSNMVCPKTKMELFCDGLLSSLTTGGVTSAGSALFVEIWKGTTSRKYLQQQILQILKYGAMNVVQNLYNYWLPHIAKISPEMLLYFCEELQKTTSSKQWFSLICVLTLCRKHGLICEDDDQRREFLKICSISSSESIRSLLFQFLCISPKTYMSPTVMEYEMIKRFLFCNVNSDCTYLRQSIVTNFTLFIIRIRDSSLNNLKLLQKMEKNIKQNISQGDEKIHVKAHLRSMSEFILWMHKFLIMNLHSEANYQRKLLSLMLYDTILRYLNGGTESIENKRKGLCRKGHLKSQGVKIRDYLLELNQWQYTDQKSLETLLCCVSDATNDVRELAMNIVKEYFIYNDFNDAKQLILNALEMCNSTTFHETECGALYIVLLLNLQKQDEVQIIFNELVHFEGDVLQTITKCLTKITEEQYLAYKSDCVNAIICHKPIYGILTTLKFILSKCIVDDTILSESDVVDVLLMIDVISNFCLESLAIKASKTEFIVAPSFSEMDDSITYLISTSRTVLNGDSYLMPTSNFQQDVFNCLWMTLRLCSDISSSLGILLSGSSKYLNSFHHDRNNMLSQCTHVIVSTLTRCRHKGVIEGAGVSLSNLIRHITKIVPSSNLPDNILDKYILSTLCASYKGPSMTRRGAGMGILFHKLISSDSRDNKPLLKSSMFSLLNILKNENFVQTKNESEINDIIEASALHYIKGLVHDASLKNDLAPYMSELTSLAFKYFFDPSWPVRNAALQLFGAIVPKLIGQKKGIISNMEDNYSDLQPCEGILHMKMDYLFIDIAELFFHYPKLSAVIQNTLKEKITKINADNLMEIHASLVPVLSLLSGAIVGVSFLYSETLMKVIQDLQDNFVKLFSSPIHVLRNLSAKAYACLTPLPYVEKKIIQICTEIAQTHGENYNHGSLLALSYLVDKFKTQGKHMFNKCAAINISNAILKLYSKFNHNVTYYTKALYFNLVYSINDCDVDANWIRTYKNMLEYAKSYKGHDPGISLYIQNLTKHGISYCDKQYIPDILNIILDNFTCVDSIKTCFTYLSKRLSTYEDESEISETYEFIFKSMSEFLLSHHDFNSVDIISLALKLLQQSVNANITFDIKQVEIFYENFVQKKRFSVTICSSALAVISSILFIKYDSLLEYEKHHCEFISAIINTVCDYSSFCSEDVRTNVVQSLNNLLLILHKNCKLGGSFAHGDMYFDVKVRCVDTVITLLQDENVRIRNEMTKFLIFNTECSAMMINSTACLLIFMNSTFLNDIFRNRNLYLSGKLQAIQQTSTKDQNMETLQYIPNVFYEKFFLEMIINQSIEISVVEQNTFFNIDSAFLKL